MTIHHYRCPQCTRTGWIKAPENFVVDPPLCHWYRQDGSMHRYQMIEVNP